jgi:hypothetical protein
VPGQYAADVPLAEDLVDPGMCVHLWPGIGPGAVEALGDGLAAPGLADVDEVVADDVRAAGVEDVEALAMVSPNARVAPSTAAPAAVPMRGLVILTRFSLRWCSAGRWPGRAGTRAPPGSGWDGPG